MSIELTTHCFSLKGLSQPEKHILTVLCFRANQHLEVYSTIERLASDCSCSTKTVERVLKKFRDNKTLTYTGKIAPKSKNIPIYRINLNNGLPVYGKILTMDSKFSNHGLSGSLTTPSEGIWIDNNIKDNIKDNAKNSLNLKNKTHNPEYQEYRTLFEAKKQHKQVPKELQPMTREEFEMMN